MFLFGLFSLLFPFHTNISQFPDGFVIHQPFPSSQSATKLYLPTLVAGTSLIFHLSLPSCLYVLLTCLFQISSSVPHLAPVLMHIHLSPLKSKY